jgi:intein-encoded DNA endonuclease-like protein
MSKFEKGHIPWNKGLKGIHLSPKTEFTSERAREIAIKTWKNPIIREKRIENKKIKFNLNPSPELAYIVGAFLGDGSISKKGVIEFLGEKEFMEEIRKNVSRIKMEGTLGIIKKCKYENCYRYIIAGAKFYNFLVPLKQNPQKALDVILHFPQYFLKGIFEAEGSFKKYNNQLRIVSNTNPQIIDLVKRACEKLNLNFNVYVYYSKLSNRKPYFELYLKGGKNMILRFLSLTNPVVKI